MTTPLNVLYIQLENTKEALKVIQAAPNDSFDLNTYFQETPCGTLFCVAGHLTTSQYFKDRGFALQRSNLGGDLWFNLTVNGSLMVSDSLNSTFGEGHSNAWELLFSSAFQSPYDAPRESIKDPADHKTMALNRLQLHIKHLENAIELGMQPK